MHAVLERVVSPIAGEVRHLDAEAAQLHPGRLAYPRTHQSFDLRSGARIAGALPRRRFGEIRRHGMITVTKAPPYLTVQDFGRRRSRAAGVPRGGAMDRFALSALNTIVGNSSDAFTRSTWPPC